MALEEVGDLVVAELRSGGVVQEPVGGSSDGGGTNVQTDNHVTEEQPGGDQSFLKLIQSFILSIRLTYLDLTWLNLA